MAVQCRKNTVILTHSEIDFLRYQSKKFNQPYFFMQTIAEIEQIVQHYHELGETLLAIEFLADQYEIKHPNLKGYAYGEKATLQLFLMTTVGHLGASQVIKIPENTFEYPVLLVVNLLAHEMVHVAQKGAENTILDKNEREWQAYYEMLFHHQFPLVPDAPNFLRKQFAQKGLDYYKRMGEGSELQLKYAQQKQEVEALLRAILMG